MLERVVDAFSEDCCCYEVIQMNLRRTDDTNKMGVRFDRVAFQIAVNEEGKIESRK